MKGRTARFTDPKSVISILALLVVAGGLVLLGFRGEDWIRAYRDPGMAERQSARASLSKEIAALEQQWINEADPEKKNDIAAVIEVKTETFRNLPLPESESWVGKAAMFVLVVGCICLFFMLHPWRMITDIMEARR